MYGSESTNPSNPVEKKSTDSVLELSLVVPVLNEAETVGLFVDKVIQVFDHHPAVHVEIVFANDGSTDATLDRLLQCQSQLDIQKQRVRVRVVDLSLFKRICGQGAPG
jgi:glycosyltransferase involved in cell wall biosynthesis